MAQGDGSQVNVWSNPWLPSGTTRRPDSTIITKVNELIDPITESWDTEFVQELFSPEDSKVILGIPLRSGMEDSLTWHHDRKGVFSVRSAYHLGTNVKEVKRN